MYTKAFQQISKSDVATVGGKGASLGEMTNAGIPVPNGFVVTTNAFKKISGKIIPQGIQEEIFKAFDELNAERVAVRSSAVAEDSSDASWAGQLESYLNVKRENLLDSVQKCWNSINSDRAKNYAKQQKITANQLTENSANQLVVAVVIQKMVESVVSGVMFTVNPVTNNLNEIMIEAAWGLGELLVQGEITPDNYIIDKKTLTITETIGSQNKMLIYKNGQNKIIPLAENIRSKLTLNKVQIEELVRLGKKIESHYGSTQDIEWAMENDKFYIVQSRPITTL